MRDLIDLTEVRQTGEQVASDNLEALRESLLQSIRRNLGLTEAPPPPCLDPAEAYLDPSSIARRINGDLPAMLIGGLSALLLQMLHPAAMAGVAQHSNYRDEPLGRLARTAQFIGTTTYGTRADAERSIARVRAIHRSVTGETSTGVPYVASDPALLRWVHAAEVASFLAAAEVYGHAPLSIGDQDAYLEDMAPVAIDLGADWVPTTRAELDRYFEDVRSELRLTREASDARNFVLMGVGRQPHQLAAYGVVANAAVGILPRWARTMLRLPLFTPADRLIARPATRVLCSAMRWATAPAQVAIESPPSTATT